MDATAVFSKVEIPLKTFGVTDLVHLGFEDIITLLTLGASNDLAFAWNKEINRSNGLSVIVFFHIEGFDLFWIVV